MSTARIEIPPKLILVFSGEADVRGAKGGRGSGKTRTFAKMSAVRGYMWSKAGREGIMLCCRQFMNSLDESSMEEVKAAIRSEPWLDAHYEIGEKYIRTKDGRISYKFAGLNKNLDSIKSKARILLCWVEEAEPVTEEAWVKLIPTLREEDSELWLTWNPENKKSATNKRFFNSADPRTKIETVNWRDNPWFPAILDRTRLKDKAERPEQYDHVWEGDFKTVVEGAYYAQALSTARQENRITAVARDPLMPVKTFWDIGVSDATSIWVAQFIGKQICVIDYYEAENQPLSVHLEWLRANGYGTAECILPHDGEKRDVVTAIRFEDHIASAGFNARTVPNQGKGAAMKRVEVARRVFPRVWFDAKKCQGGLDALGWYHEKRDEERGIGLGPEHDWASHGADAFGLLCVDYEEPRIQQGRKRYSGASGGSTSWMAG